MNYYKTLEDIFDLVNSLNDDTLTTIQRKTLEASLRRKVRLLKKD